MIGLERTMRQADFEYNIVSKLETISCVVEYQPVESKTPPQRERRFAKEKSVA
jgi:hypothetical protein